MPMNAMCCKSDDIIPRLCAKEIPPAARRVNGSMLDASLLLCLGNGLSSVQIYSTVVKYEKVEWFRLFEVDKNSFSELVVVDFVKLNKSDLDSVPRNCWLLLLWLKMKTVQVCTSGGLLRGGCL